MGNLVAAIQGASIAIVVALCILMFYRLTISMMQDQCISGTNMLAYELANYDGPEDKTALLDTLKEQMGYEFTIFHGDQRAYTTIQQNGQRAVGTRLSGDVARIVLEQGQSYVGRAAILGETHLCSYVPTRDANGQVDGLIFAGISMTEASGQINLTMLLSCLVGVTCVILGIMIAGAYIMRAVSRPLFRLTILAQTLEQGDLGLHQHQTMAVDIHSNDEIGTLAQSFDMTIGRLRNYIGEISTMLESVAGGDLTAQITQEYVGDFASIRTSLNDILQKLNDTMGQIVSSAEYVSNGASQMSTASQALSQGAMEQTGAVEELPAFFSTLPIPTYLVYALIFFFGAIVVGSQGIIVLCMPMAMAALHGGPALALFILLMSMNYVAMQISPVHICLTLCAEDYKVPLGSMILKTMPMVVVFTVLSFGYYFLLNAIGL